MFSVSSFPSVVTYAGEAASKLQVIHGLCNAIVLLGDIVPKAINGVLTLSCMLWHWCKWSEAASYVNRENCPPTIGPIQYAAVQKIKEIIKKNHSFEDIDSVVVKQFKMISPLDEGTLETFLWDNFSTLGSNFNLNIKVSSKDKDSTALSYEYNRQATFLFATCWTSNKGISAEKKNN